MRLFYADSMAMGMFFFADTRKSTGVCLSFYVACSVLWAQNAALLQDTGVSNKKPPVDPAVKGVWENKERFVMFDDGAVMQSGTADHKTEPAKIVLKPFYGYYYDGIYDAGTYTEGMPLAVFNEGLYTEFWTSHKAAGGTFWRPENNRRDFTIETVPIARELAGYYTSDDFKTVYKIRYWITKADFSGEKAELRIPDYPPKDFADTILIDKYIKIDSTVYTCATGRRTYVRNPEKLVSLPENAHIGDILVFGEPLLKRSIVTDLKAEIDAHNSIVYPPRNGRIRFIEPSIYKKLETTGPDDFYNIRVR